jgi:DNA-binding XRE family transcriptional regulator
MVHRLISHIRPLRRRWGFTQQEFAWLIGGQSHTSISRIERLKANPSLDAAIACSIIFDMPLIELFPYSYMQVYEKLLLRAQDLYEELQGTPAQGTRRKLDFLEDVLARTKKRARANGI